jgi:hypothetical protein
MDFEGYASEGDRRNRDILYVDLLMNENTLNATLWLFCHLKNGHEITLTLVMAC